MMLTARSKLLYLPRQIIKDKSEKGHAETDSVVITGKFLYEGTGHAA
jgi:hypothetical protein